MRALWNNLFDNFTPSVSSEATNYGVENAQNISLDKVWRTTDDATEYVTIDAGAGETLTIDSIAILEHNLTNAAVIKIQMNATDAWGAPSVDETITWREGIIMHYLAASSTYRFARLYFEDDANTDGYIEIGRIFECEYLQFDPSSTIEVPIANVRNDVQIFSDSNVMWSRQGVGYRQFRYKFPPSAEAMITKIRTMYNAIGKHKSFVFTNYDESFSKIEPAYVVIVNNFEEDWNGAKAEYELRLRETK